MLQEFQFYFNIDTFILLQNSFKAVLQMSICI